jgi:hypothetical protein
LLFFALCFSSLRLYSIILASAPVRAEVFRDPYNIAAVVNIVPWGQVDNFNSYNIDAISLCFDPDKLKGLVTRVWV